MKPSLLLVTDTNTWIDLENGEVLELIFELPCKFKILAVKKLPVSGSPSELIKYEGISQENIVNEVKEMLRTK